MSTAAPATDIPRQISKILIDLDEMAGRVIARPEIAFGERWQLAPLTAEVTEAVKRPVEDERTIDGAAVMLCQALAKLTERLPRPVERKWLAIAAALKDQIRGDAARAVEVELKQLTTRDHDYHRRD